jgi:DNA-binding transcriptional LysR family regulator
MSVFAKVADLASKELRMSPTMIGKHIRFLEQRLGSQLINRSAPAHEQRSPQQAESPE